MLKYKETIKTVVITILITGILAFIAGVNYADGQFKSLKLEVQDQVKLLKQ